MSSEILSMPTPNATVEIECLDGGFAIDLYREGLAVNTLITGKDGLGKTKLLKQISKQLDAAGYTGQGIQCESVEHTGTTPVKQIFGDGPSTQWLTREPNEDLEAWVQRMEKKLEYLVSEAADNEFAIFNYLLIDDASLILLGDTTRKLLLRLLSSSTPIPVIIVADRFHSDWTAPHKYKGVYFLNTITLQRHYDIVYYNVRTVKNGTSMIQGMFDEHVHIAWKRDPDAESKIHEATVIAMRDEDGETYGIK